MLIAHVAFFLYENLFIRKMERESDVKACGYSPYNSHKQYLLKMYIVKSATITSPNTFEIHDHSFRARSTGSPNTKIRLKHNNLSSRSMATSP